MKVAQIPTTKADLSLRIFVAVPGTLKRPSAHAGDCAAALYVIIYILAKMLFYGLILYLFAYSCRKIKRFNAPEISPKLSREIQFRTFGNVNVNRFCLHTRLKTLVVCLLHNSAYVLSELILKLSEEFEIMLST